jgi:dienelactone hydrolase
MRKRGLIVALALSWAGPAAAGLHAETVEYRDGDTALRGYLAYDDGLQGRRPGVLVVHEWRGLDDYAKGRANQLAALGYVAFAVDMYGAGVYAKDHNEAAQLSAVYRQDRARMRARALAGLELLRQHAMTDPHYVAAIGYCFGGTTVLELARAGEPLGGVVSFHGGLDTPAPAEAGRIEAKVLVLHGGRDGFVTGDQVAAFRQEMEQAGADYRLVIYPEAAHSFTVPTAGGDPSAGMAYDADADARSWQEMQRFFGEIFQGAPFLQADASKAGGGT